MKYLIPFGLLGMLLLAVESWSEPERIGTLDNSRVSESSGLAASWRNPGLYWTVNDSGNTPQVYLFDEQGRDRGTWTITGARNRDWEDLAVGPGPERGRSYLYIADIGDNYSRRKEIAVYRVPEPEASAGANSLPAQTIRLRYPDGPRDAEALVVHPRTGDIHIISKGSNPTVYRASGRQPTGVITTMLRLASLKLPDGFEMPIIGGRLTGAAVSKDGNRVILCDYFRAYEAVLPQGKGFEHIWSQPWQTVEVGLRRQGEAITYRLDGQALLLTSEGRPTPIYRLLRAR